MSAELYKMLLEMKTLSLEELLILQEKLAQQVRLKVTSNGQLDEKSKWPEGFIEKTYGSLRDEPLEREYEGEYEEREAIS